MTVNHDVPGSSPGSEAKQFRMDTPMLLLIILLIIVLGGGGYTYRDNLGPFGGIIGLLLVVLLVLALMGRLPSLGL